MHLVCGYCSFSTITHWPLKRASEGALILCKWRYIYYRFCGMRSWYLRLMHNNAVSCGTSETKAFIDSVVFVISAVPWRLPTQKKREKKSRDSLNIFCNLQTDILWRLCAISVQFLWPIIWSTLNRNFYSSPVIFQHRLKDRPCISRTYNEHFKLLCPEAIALAESE